MTQSRVALRAVQPEEFASLGLWGLLAALAVRGGGEGPELWGDNGQFGMFCTPSSCILSYSPNVGSPALVSAVAESR